MSKFNKPTVQPNVISPITTVGTGTTHAGGQGYVRDAKSELFLLAVTNMVSENTFYETADVRDNRFAHLVREVAACDPDWIARMIPWLRNEANMRSASLVAACEYAWARRDEAGTGREGTFYPAPTATTRSVIASALVRADEPGEMLAYWTSKYGRKIPKPVKRGVADAVQRLYNERSFLKWDSDAKGFRFGDVLELTHPSPHPDKPWQGDLFKHAIDKRHNRSGGDDSGVSPSVLRMISTRWSLMGMPVGNRRACLSQPNFSNVLAEAGMTWEAMAGWLQGPMDKVAWEAIIPSMGYMALLRNLRNFDEAGVSDGVAMSICARLSDQHEVARSRQLPFRFLSAYRAAPSDRWKWALEQALGYSLANIPQLPGRTLILIDTSGSMNAGFSKDGTLMRWDAAALFGIALAQRCDNADIVSFASHVKTFPQVRGEGVLKALARFKREYFLNGGTETAMALRSSFHNHDRVVLLTDEQTFWDYSGGVTATVPKDVPMYTANLAGHRVGHTPSGSGTRHTWGGLTDHMFKVIPLLESGRNADWPF